MLLPLWRPGNRRTRQDYVLAVSCLTALLALLAVFTGTGEEALVLLRLGGHLSVAFRGGRTVRRLCRSGQPAVAAGQPLRPGVHEPGGEGGPLLAFYLAAFGVTLGVAFSANIVTMYFFYELLTLATPASGDAQHGRQGPVCRTGLSGLLHERGRRWALSPWSFSSSTAAACLPWAAGWAAEGVAPNLLLTAYVLGFFGFGAKAAVFPFHTWLLRASVAPTPVTALLHAVAVVKAGVFAVIRVTWYGFGPDLVRGPGPTD